jgi:hypothetical protein
MELIHLKCFSLIFFNVSLLPKEVAALIKTFFFTCCGDRRSRPEWKNEGIFALRKLATACQAA